MGRAECGHAAYHALIEAYKRRGVETSGSAESTEVLAGVEAAEFQVESEVRIGIESGVRAGIEFEAQAQA